MNKPCVFTPGPTNVRENVRLARAMETTNPDLDKDFYNFYRETCNKIGKLLNTEKDVFILSGEGILGLEATCASLTEPSDRVLIIDNGVFGEGFADFVKIYGGIPVLYSVDRQREIDIKKLKAFLDKDSNFKYATVVHCDTPSGVLNDISEICPIIKKYGILTVVDSVAAMGGEPIKVDEWGIDVALGGSQKAFSAPPGLSIVTISDDADKAMRTRNTPIMGFYCNLTIWKGYYEKKWFPYTMPISDIYGLRVAIDNIIEEGIDNVHKRHRNIAVATRSALTNYGLKLYLDSGFSSTVTVVEPPEGIEAKELIRHMRDNYNLLISGSFDYLENKVIRIGHMGENATINKIIFVLNMLDKSLKDLGYKSKINLVEEFNKYSIL
jgi:aspartate aminotransferase-like enzyme